MGPLFPDRLCLSLPLLLVGCGSVAELSDEDRLDPQACASCHPDHVRQWSGSMHAYAAVDPVFLALNREGQRVSHGGLGAFCIQCHAPIAVGLGETEDGLNLDEIDPTHLGVTCAACHTAVAVTHPFNNGLERVLDSPFRGAIEDPLPTGAHGVESSDLHDRRSPASSRLCASCHDVITPAGVHLERTYAEWSETVYADAQGASARTCGDCHMVARDAPAADVDGAPTRQVHDHSFPGVDLALTDFPEREAQRASIRALLSGAVRMRLCVEDRGDGVDVALTVENRGAGHGVPSGASIDRRVWARVEASSGGVVTWKTGVRGPDEAVRGGKDDDLWEFGDRATNAFGEEVHMFWEARWVEPGNLPGAVTHDPDDPAFELHHQTRRWSLPYPLPDRVEAQVHLRPLDHDLVATVAATGFLDPSTENPVVTWDLSPAPVVWTGDLG